MRNIRDYRTTRTLIVLLILCFSLSFEPSTNVHRRRFLEILPAPFLCTIPTPVWGTESSWTGTNLPLLSISDAYKTPGNSWSMGRWPDPILRRRAKPVPFEYFGTDILSSLCTKLMNTCRDADAVGLAAQQCGVDAQIVYLEKNVVLINPRIIERSPEVEMSVWEERCLVMPPDFVATVLRDKDILVEAEDVSGRTRRIKLSGELARACQHEMDHSNGILIVDHVDITEIPSYMRPIEDADHEARQIVAFSRTIASTSVSYSTPKFSSLYIANADDNGLKCDESCRKRLEDRRALYQQSRTTNNRQEMFDLSRQRAALYNTTSRASTCIPGLPCL